MPFHFNEGNESGTGDGLVKFGVETHNEYAYMCVGTNEILFIQLTTTNSF
jgi:hypothetical protein